MKVVLTIGGSDPIAGAGIQADIKTISALKCYGCTVITSITSQNTRKVTDVYDLPAKVVKSQFEAVAEEFYISAVKIGMLSNAEIINTVVEMLERYKIKNIVVDPVMVSSSGKKLLNDDAIDELKKLISFSTLVTPNKQECEVLLKTLFKDKSSILDQIDKIKGMKTENILIKGGHFEGNSATDILICGENVVEFTAEKLQITDVHGTGCTLSSAIACNLAKGYDVITAVRYAKEYIFGAIKSSIRFNDKNRQSLINHFYAGDK